MKVIEIEGIGPAYAEKLAGIGITTVEGLLEKGGAPRGRKEIATATGISDALVLRWVNIADLYRIRGVARQYSELLETAGVDTVVELSKRVPANLEKKMQEVNAVKKCVNKLPTLKQVEAWVAQAKTLPRVITH
jgi:predicted flap endonuclease-1-like 5' DNA nuclease